MLFRKVQKKNELKQKLGIHFSIQNNNIERQMLRETLKKKSILFVCLFING